MIKIALVDDQIMVRQGIAQLIELNPEFEVVLQMDNGEEALKHLLNTDIDLIISDIQMPKMNGIRFVEILRGRGHQTPVLVLTTFNDHELLTQAIKAGCNGFLLKDAGLDKLSSSIRNVAQGHYLFEPQYFNLDSNQEQTLEIDSPLPLDLDQLTDTELQILRFIAAGFNNKDISSCLNLAEGTIKNYISKILEKTNSRDRTQAVVKALAWKLI